VIHPVLLQYTKKQKARREKDGIAEPPAGKWESWDHSEEAYGWSISFPYTPNQTKPVDYVFNQIAIDNITADYEEDSDEYKQLFDEYMAIKAEFGFESVPYVIIYKDGEVYEKMEDFIDDNYLWLEVAEQEKEEKKGLERVENIIAAYKEATKEEPVASK
jgi:hypothetical protein